jgi:hypothetical protein
VSRGRDGDYILGDPVDLDEEDDLVPGSEDLLDDIRDDDIGIDEDPEAAELPDDDLEAPAAGEPFTGDVPLG